VLSKIPDGYWIAYAATLDTSSILELVPKGETIGEWTEMVTAQVFSNKNELTLLEVRDGMEKMWRDTFPGSSSEFIEQGFEHNHPVMIWSQLAPLNLKTGKPEMTWFKASIRDGKIAIIHKAFKFSPSVEQIAYWLAFLRDVRIVESGSSSTSARAQ
jgi:hypothetical protein